MLNSNNGLKPRAPSLSSIIGFKGYKGVLGKRVRDIASLESIDDRCLKFGINLSLGISKSLPFIKRNLEGFFLDY